MLTSLLAKPRHWGRAFGRATPIALIAIAISAFQSVADANTQAVAQSIAQVIVPQTPSQTNFDLGVVRSRLSDLSQYPLFFTNDPDVLVASSEQLSPTQLSRPSLFWIQDQVDDRYGSDRLIQQWQAYRVGGVNSDLNYVDVVVNEPIWSLLNYFERYAFISQFGTAAKDYGYQLRVFNSGDAVNYRESRDLSSSSNNRLVRLRGAHVCSFEQAIFPLSPEAAAALKCSIVLDEASRRPPVSRPF